jgi:signal peptidase I
MSQEKKESILKKWWDKYKQNKEEKKKKKPQTFKEKVIENVKVFFSAYLIAFVIRLVMIEGYQIPSQSMVPSLRVRDILMVEKLSMGALLPLTRWKMPAFARPKRNDIIVFVSPNWENPGFGKEFISLITLSLVNLDNTPDNPKNLVKRLVALPGDTVMMTNSMVYLNGRPIETKYLGRNRQIIFDNMQYAGHWNYDLYSETYDGKERIIQHAQSGDFSVDANSLNRQFDTIVVPQKGVHINLREANNYYKGLLIHLIEAETGETVTVDAGGNLILNAKVLTEWIPKDDYYFAMGDNRDNSLDCRYFGFIPRKNIFGRILFRYFPFKRFRFGKGVNENSDDVMSKDFSK